MTDGWQIVKRKAMAVSKPFTVLDDTNALCHVPLVSFIGDRAVRHNSAGTSHDLNGCERERRHYVHARMVASVCALGRPSIGAHCGRTTSVVPWPHT